jgi:hypothetical protein
MRWILAATRQVNHNMVDTQIEIERDSMEYTRDITTIIFKYSRAALYDRE